MDYRADMFGVALRIDLINGKYTAVASKFGVN
jgi:hypothetical protein